MPPKAEWKTVKEEINMEDKGMKFEVKDNIHPSSVRCPKCRNIIRFDLQAWHSNPRTVFQDNCPHCGKDVYIGLFVLAQDTPKKLERMVEQIIQLLDASRKGTLQDAKPRIITSQ